jgi:molecular chaperone GrpE (heat shock protein)
MRTHAEKAAHYRKRAREMRELATRATSENVREKLLKTVDDYERLARIQDQLAADDPRSL